MTAQTPDEAAAPCQKCQVYPDRTVYRTRCICPEPMTAEETLRGVAGLGGGIGDAVRDVLAERDALRAENGRLREALAPMLAAADQVGPYAQGIRVDECRDAVMAVNGETVV